MDPQPHAESRSIREIEHVWIPLSDGVRLSARIWLPGDAETNPVPAVLEYLPYRKDDATAADDATRHPYFAAHGYASVRVDIRGTGDSEGICLDEYLASEHDDALEVLAWLAEQPWCTGACAMIGYSWGGFNALQVAARRPPQLKAIVSGCSTDDRYTDDCHYSGGCLLASDMLKWASWMHAFNCRPPDPRFVGEAWRDQWLQRLRETPPYIEPWLAHPLRDAYWRQGSVDEDYTAIEAATLLFGGLADPYRTTIPRMLEHLRCPRAAIVGPWGHMFPDHGVPEPAIGFVQECVRWFDRWLKGIPNGVEDDPMLRIYVQESLPPSTSHPAVQPGRWVSERAWPPASVTERTMALTAQGTLADCDERGAGVGAERGSEERVAIIGDQTCGSVAGVWCPNGLDDEMPADQRDDDVRSLCFDSAPLAEPVVLFGVPVVRLALSVDREIALVSVRLCEVAPDGSSKLLGWGLLNLTHRDGHASWRPIVPGERREVAVPLGLVAQHVSAGDRLRLAVSPTYWPHAWPSPEPVTLTLHLDGGSVLVLPERAAQAADATPPGFAAPVGSAPVHGTIETQATRRRTVTPRDQGEGLRTVNIQDVTETRSDISATGTVYAEQARDAWTILSDDPLSAAIECERDVTIDREGWHVRVVTGARQTCDQTHIHVTTTVDAYEGDELVFSDRRNHAIAREGY